MVIFLKPTVRNKKGFSLIELMVAIAIIAVLAAVATRWYRNYTRSSFESDLIQALLAARVAQEQYRAERGTYAATIEDLPRYNDGEEDNSFVIHEDKDARRRIVLRVEDADDDGYTIVAENEAEGEWHLEWRLSCSRDEPDEACTPVQTAGTGVLKNVF
ncbi:type IV pilin protein [Thermodesulforhabdus norvegica]|uniref:Prepilin-type N-terminal cleavage/methylation domain-containing protein n=1 Tax=Thermodesulforhabdus norvegica TaxID=39841 RepID=A0A1I4U035_9BACT|nr:prepilin-type N-terminal cleavage/methylation domain-containing protein [Thermodesulforhabdus norvegica]SFM82372.1 prepilin-type N-terminal cleavage/methylation domain-containing protein [Thermodesulforhabdus norvegica]